MNKLEISFSSRVPYNSDDDHLNLINTSIELSKNNIVMYCNRDTNDDFYIKNKGILNITYYDITYTAGRRKINADGSFSAKKASEILLHNIDKKRKVDDFLV
jgi:hypothetical protein